MKRVIIVCDLCGKEIEPEHSAFPILPEVNNVKAIIRFMVEDVCQTCSEKWILEYANKISEGVIPIEIINK